MSYWPNDEQQSNPGGYTSMPRPSSGSYPTQMPSVPQVPRAPYQAPPLQPSAPVLKPAPNPSWNTDGYQAPAYTANRANAKAIPGWDMAKWQNQSHQTPKYAVGRILSQWAPKTENLPHAFQEIQRAYPQATFDGKDKIDLDGAGPMSPVDVLEGAGVGGKAWRWGADDGAQAVQGGTDNILAALLGLASGGFNQAPQQPAFDQSAFLGQLQQLFSQYQTPQANGPRIVWG
jgi:hypothetical protein